MLSRITGHPSHKSRQHIQQVLALPDEDEATETPVLAFDLEAEIEAIIKKDKERLDIRANVRRTSKISCQQIQDRRLLLKTRKFSSSSLRSKTNRAHVST